MIGKRLFKKFYLSYYPEKCPSETILKMCPSKHDAIFPPKYETVITLELKQNCKGPPFQLMF